MIDSTRIGAAVILPLEFMSEQTALATFVFVVERTEEGFFLLKYAADGHCLGDTWHPTVEEAKEQAAHELAGATLAWKSIPLDINDVVAFLTAQ